MSSSQQEFLQIIEPDNLDSKYWSLFSDEKRLKPLKYSYPKSKIDKSYEIQVLGLLKLSLLP